MRILERLGLDGERRRRTAGTSSVPTFRADVLREVDLIEEVGATSASTRLPATFPAADRRRQPPPDPRIARDQLVRRVLTAAGVSEAVTFGFIEAKAAAPFADGVERPPLVGIANPLSAKFDTMRPSLLPGLVDSVAHNRRHGRRDVGLFEIGTRFSSSAGESRGLAFAWTGSVAEHWKQRVAPRRFLRRQGRGRTPVRRARRRARGSSRRPRRFWRPARPRPCSRAARHSASSAC